jgi:hypothetical protein
MTSSSLTPPPPRRIDKAGQRIDGPKLKIMELIRNTAQMARFPITRPCCWK